MARTNGPEMVRKRFCFGQDAWVLATYTPGSPGQRPWLKASSGAQSRCTNRRKENTMPAQATLEAFKARLRGELLQANDAGYETARQVYNGMIDRHPRLIVRCANVADVIAAVHFGRDNDMLVAVRGGGDNAGGLGVCDDGLVIDLAPIKYVRVDPSSRTVRVGGGCTWSDVDHATHAFGLAVPSGIISSTGVAGLTLGGGM